LRMSSRKNSSIITNSWLMCLFRQSESLHIHHIQDWYFAIHRNLAASVEVNSDKIDWDNMSDWGFVTGQRHWWISGSFGRFSLALVCISSCSVCSHCLYCFCYRRWNFLSLYQVNQCWIMAIQLWIRCIT
jgi:hypothetical protein